ERPQREFVMRDLLPAKQQEQSNRNRPKYIHQRRADRSRSDRSQIRPKQLLRGLAKARNLPRFHAEGFYDPVAGDGFLQDVLNVRQLILPAAGGMADAASDLDRRVNDEGHKQYQHPG